MKITYVLLTLLALNVISANGQTANFSFSTPNNLFCSPQVVTFVASTTGNPDSYIWNFGDGLSGSGPVENHLYDYPGTYNVTLTAVFANTASTITKTVIINPSPVVSLTASRTQLCQPGSVSFTASTSGSANSWLWDFGDGSSTQTTTVDNVSHNFTGFGTFNVTVKASSSNGCSGTGSVSVAIARFPINVQVSPLNGCLPANANFTATTSFPPGDGLQNIIWNFGDGTPNATGSSPTISHIYNTTTPITTAGVTITSNQGCTNQFTLPRFAYGIPPINTNAYITALRDTFCGSETIEFFGFADSANTYIWNYGDGSGDTTTNSLITHKYSTLGNHTVVLTPYYNGCAGAPVSFNVHITGVIASYTYSNTCSNKRTFSFLNNSLGNISYYQWTYSDMPGFLETTNYSPVHTFPTPGTFDTKLLVVDNITGCRDSMSSTIHTATPSLISDRTNVCRDSAIIYTVQNTYPAGLGYTYQYHVNGLVIDAAGFTAITLHPRDYGTFNDYVVIRDNHPGTCDDTLYVGPVNVRGPLMVFSVPIRQCVDSALTIQNLSYPWFAQDSIVKWRWDFADGLKDSVQHPPPHVYTIPGQRIINLKATDINGCSQTVEWPVYMAPLPDISIFPAIDTLCLGESATLMAYTGDSLTWVTNTSCNTCDTVNVAPTITTEYIAMSVSQFGCKNYDTSLVKVFTPINLTLTPIQTSVCAGTPVQYNVNFAGNVTWSPSLYLNNASIPNPVSTPQADITYTVRARDSVGCFSDSVTASITVFPDPVVDAGPDQFLPYNTSFTLAPVYAPGTQTYLWTPAGNLSCTNCPSPSGIALQRQQFTIEVTDGNGCKGKDDVTVFVGCELSNLLLPSAFTPNGDGRNERFYPIARGYKEIKSFTIFNRSGAKVFEKKNFQPNIPSEGWDGRVKNGKVENTQSYVWIIEGICDTGASIVTKGTVLLIR